MLVIVTESIPPRLRGWLSRLFLEVRAGVYVGTYSVRIRDLVWNQIQGELGDGNVVMVWPSNNDIGFEFDTCGVNRRIPVDMDGLMLCSFQPTESASRDAVPQGAFSSDDNW